MADPKDKDNQEDGLPRLTEKQMNFVLCIQKGYNQTDAYRASYDCEGTPDRQLWVRASELARTSKVAVWLDYLKAQQITEATYTKEQHLKDMAEAARHCKEVGAPSAYVKATESLGRCAGHYVDKVEIEHTRKADIDLLDQVEKSLGPQAREEAARRLGLH